MKANTKVVRDESERAHRYEPAAPEDETRRRPVGDLLRKAFDGSAEKLVMQGLKKSAGAVPRRFEELPALTWPGTGTSGARRPGRRSNGRG